MAKFHNLRLEHQYRTVCMNQAVTMQTSIAPPPPSPALELAGQHLEDSLAACCFALLLGMLTTHDRVGVTCAKEANIGNICKPVCMCMEAEGNIVLNCMGMATGHPVMPELEFGSSGPYASL